MFNKGNRKGNKTTDGVKSLGIGSEFKQGWQAKGHGTRECFNKTLNQVPRQIS